MDDRTSRLLEALDPVGVELLVELLAETATEATLVAAVRESSQAPVNRRLQRLRSARLVFQEAGARRAPGRFWSVVHPAETEALLGALFDLSDTIDARDRGRRAQARRRVKRARAARLGIRRVD